MTEAVLVDRRSVRMLEWALLATATLSACLFSGPARAEPSFREVPYQSSESVRRAFNLMDHEGRSVTDLTYRGKSLLVFFGFISCPDICPTGLVEIAEAVRQLDKRSIEITPLFITVDPDRDTPTVLSQYVKSFHPRLVGLTGTRQNITNAAAAFGAEFGVRKAGQVHYVWHSASTYLLGRNGELLKVFPPYVRAATIVRDADRLMKYVKSTPERNGQ